MSHNNLSDHAFFFSSRRRHTRLQGDWSSDVCSSDLDGRPAVYSVDSIPADIVSVSANRSALRGSLYRLLAEQRHPVDHGEAIVSPAVADAELAQLLHVEHGTLLQHLKQVDYDTSDRPVMFSLEWHVPSVFEVSVYRRGPGPLAAEHD